MKSKLKLLPTIIVKYSIRAFYILMCIFKVDQHKITFASYRSNTLNGNLFYVWKEIRESYPEYQCHLAIYRLNSSLLGKIKYVFHMVKITYHIATSSKFIIDDFYFPIYLIKPRKGTEVIQLWHASGALKKFGYSTVGKPFGPSKEYLQHVKIHSNYSKVYVSSSEVVPHFAEAFNMDADRILPYGIPRTDILFSERFFDKSLAKLTTYFPYCKEKKRILYAPTYRGKSHYQSEFCLPFDIKLMEEFLHEDYVLLVHLHPYMKASKELVKNSGDFLFYVNNEMTIQELLVTADLLITDYSTVFFDYSLLDRPILFYVDDLDEYIKERDFYYNYTDIVPGPIIKDTPNLIQYLKNEEFDKTAVDRFKRRFFEYTDGKATKRIVEHLLKP